jgi:hypothetical protein
MIRIIFIVVILSISLGSCREAYTPPFIDIQKSFLVVEANLNPGPGITNVSLSRTTSLKSSGAPVFVNNAQVIVEGKDNSNYPLAGIGGGQYRSSLSLVIGNEYRLRITTSEGKTYLSSYVMAKQSPPIDSIGWDREGADIRIHANTKDLSGSSKYYRWDYDETWEQRSAYFSDLIYIHPTNTIRERVLPDEDVSVCWTGRTSTEILLANSTRLASDIIHKAPLILIPRGSEKLGVRYSVLVRQYVLDRDAYNFFELMRKNTEEIGSLFSPQPSEVRGNITCTSDAQEYVLGYVTASTVEQSRIFIRIPWTYSQYCPEIRVPANPDSLRAVFGSGSVMPYLYNFPPPVYIGSFSECVDCRTRGGTTVRPSFW